MRHFSVPANEPEDIIPHLAKQELHWRDGYSAKELARCWFRAGERFPPAVRAVLDTAPEYEGAELVDGFFERKVDLRTPGRESQTDLLVIAGLKEGIGVIAVEGKVEETFGELVAPWNTTRGKDLRLRALCATLGLDPAGAGGLRYQLLHRTASAIYEAQRYRCRNALMLVQSFSRSRQGFADFAAFTAAMGQPLSAPGSASIQKVCEGVALRLAWAADSIAL